MAALTFSNASKPSWYIKVSEFIAMHANVIMFITFPNKSLNSTDYVYVSALKGIRQSDSIKRVNSL